MWTLGIELVFYPLAPWLVRRSWVTLLALTVVAALPRVWLVWSDNNVDPWNRSVLPFEMIYFLFGIWSYRLYARLRERPPHRLILIVVSVLAFWQANMGLSSEEWRTMFVITAATPALFLLTARSKLDRLLGELSYPVYAGHFLVLGLLYPSSVWLVEVGGSSGAVVIHLVTVLLLAATLFLSLIHI